MGGAGCAEFMYVETDPQRNEASLAGTGSMLTLIMVFNKGKGSGRPEWPRAWCWPLAVTAMRHSFDARERLASLTRYGALTWCALSMLMLACILVPPMCSVNWDFPCTHRCRQQHMFAMHACAASSPSPCPLASPLSTVCMPQESGQARSGCADETCRELDASDMAGSIDSSLSIAGASFITITGTRAVSSHARPPRLPPSHDGGWQCKVCCKAIRQSCTRAMF